jgi:hypothetical protein
MRLFGRRPLPDVLKREVQPALHHSEHLQAWAALADGAAVAATDHGLWYDAGRGFRRLPWEDVETVVWRDGELVVVEASERFGSGPSHRFRLTDAHNLPDVVRTRVESSIVLSQHHKVSAAGGLRVVARRRGGSSGLSWRLVFDAGVDPTDPEVTAKGEALLNEAKGSVAADIADL